MSDDGDERNEVTIYRHKMGLYDKEEVSITLKSKTDSVAELLVKAEKAARNDFKDVS